MWPVISLSKRRVASAACKLNSGNLEKHLLPPILELRHRDLLFKNLLTVSWPTPFRNGGIVVFETAQIVLFKSHPEPCSDSERPVTRHLHTPPWLLHHDTSRHCNILRPYQQMAVFLNLVSTIADLKRVSFSVAYRNMLNYVAETVRRVWHLLRIGTRMWPIWLALSTTNRPNSD